MKIVLIQDTWNEEDDQELLDFMKNNNIDFYTKSKEEILECDPKNHIIFADTWVMTELFKKNNITDEWNSYPFELSNMYYRNITVEKLGKINRNFPFFIKSVENKVIEGFVVENNQDLKYITDGKNLDSDVYISNVIEFTNEFRIFYGNSKIWGIVESTEYIMNKHGTNVEIPHEFIKECISKIKDNFYVLDIGMLKNGTWAVVEINPPYSLSSYSLDIKIYFDYCSSFFNCMWK